MTTPKESALSNSLPHAFPKRPPRAPLDVAKLRELLSKHNVAELEKLLAGDQRLLAYVRELASKAGAR